MKVCVVLIALFAAVLAQPPRPKLPNVFESRIYVDIRMNGTNNETIRGEGWWAFDEPEGKALENYEFGQRHDIDVFLLQRYDRGEEYEVQNQTVCHHQPVNGTIPQVWGWLSQATYQGRDHFGNVEVDVWEASIGYARVAVGVHINDSSAPVFYARHGTQRDIIFFFNSFEARKPNENLFFPPRSCNTRAVEGKSAPKCVGRDAMINRAQAWVNAKVPYNQGGYYEGYREDCSGFVSMAWELSSSLTTETLPTVAHRIAKADLAPGDVLLDTAEHVVLFGGWSSGQTEYIAYEETKPGEGTVKRATPYPYWYNTAAFLPYRFNSVC